ncbi:MAG: hypothetical protein ABJC10_13365 [Acidobacteriota bacterium]
MEVDLSKQYQTMLTLWFALFMSVIMYFLLALFVAPNASNQSADQPNTLLLLGLSLLGSFFIALSLAIKKKFLNRSVEQQDLGLVQKGMIIGCAMCEVTALLGLLGHFVAGNREYYLLFALAAGGMTLHFPRRSQLEAASYKSKSIVN